MQKWPRIPSSEITPEKVYINRRQFMKGVAIGAGALALAACAAPAAPTPAATPAAGGSPTAVTPPGLLPPSDAAPQAGKTTDETRRLR